MNLEEIIYGACGINFAELNEDQKVDCKKVKVNKAKIEEIEEKLKAANEDLTTIEVLLILLQYGPSVKEDQAEAVILEEGYIREE